MTVEEFKNLKTKEKFWMVTEQAVFIMNREELGCPVFLFSLDKFFVEVWFDNNTYFANSLQIIDSTRGLKKYLDMINIGDLNPLLK